MPELIVEHLTKRYPGAGRAAVDDVSFTVADGEFFTLLGPSGCGKSTTLAAIAGLEAPSGGRIAAGSLVYSDGSTFLAPEERNLGMVFQSYALWPHMTVAANLELPLKLRKLPREERDRRIDDVLGQVGLSDCRSRFPHQMSGGQQQRVALARALVYSPTLLLLDEPLSNLDAQLRQQARAWLKELQRSVGITTVYVTHDQAEALTLSDRIAVLRDGKVLQLGTPEEIYERPAIPAVADFIGRCNFLPATVLSARDGSVRLRVQATGTELSVDVRDGSHRAGDEVTLGIRTERFALPGSENALPVKLTKRLYSGSWYEYELDCGGHTLFARHTARVDPGELMLGVPRDGAYVFAGGLP
ncbi:ABC transporter ATP-binding protein [Pseudonocardia acaciae]|uniref:ABC transporter ATP-binding protein n=1 Tax=Pseudonocardia acaciae TaxID=551276 RepID=UPI0006889DDF|nr:ABC transporter ATP-binding protein [Pseudonocardia acaciae]